VDVLKWEDVSEDWRPDGALRDVYVFDATEADWQRVVDAVRGRWSSTYQVDGQAAQMPEAVREIFRAASSQRPLWQIKLRDGIVANCHFFGGEEIEFDLDPREVSSQLDLDVVCEFLRVVGQATAKPSVLSAENSPDLPIARYDPETDRITHVTPPLPERL
jgi:hypothetical protein